MTAPFTRRQGEYLAFIHRFAAKHGVAPSFAEIGSHFGTSAPCVNGMIKTLERRGLLSRVPGAARSLRVLVPGALLPDSDFGFRAARVSSSEAAFVAAAAVMDVFMGVADGMDIALRAVAAVRISLAKAGLGDEEVQEVARCLTAQVRRR